MDRSKRAIKTPKRFDDEAFETPPKSQQPAKPVEAAKPTIEPAQPKSIIKVKLTTKVRPRESFEPRAQQSAKQATETPKSSTKPAAKSSATKPPPEPPKSTIKIKPPTRVRPRESIEPRAQTPAKPAEATTKTITPRSAPETTATTTPQSKGTIKIKPTTTSTPKVRPPRESIEASPELRKDNSASKTKPTKPKPRDTVKPAIEVKTSERDYRPRSKRPRTQPVFADIIPNVVLPFWDARTAAEDHEDDNVKELVHCHCGVSEELGLMVQCETCLTWQHAHCLGIERPEDAPDGYTCRACSDPKFAREPMKWAYDQDWLIKGRMKQFSCDPRPIPEKNVDILKQINNLIGNVLNIHLIIHSLRIKTKLLENASDDDPELKLFRVQWPANYQHRDGTHFISTINHPSSTPASTISVIGETPDPGDINVAEATLPDIGQLDDVSAILDDTYVPNLPVQHMAANHDVKPNDCRANLRLHIQQTEEFIGIELTQIEEKLSNLEKECSLIKSGNLETSLDSLKNDLQTMKKYVENRE